MNPAVFKWGYTLPTVSAFVEISIEEYAADGQVEKRTYNGKIPEELMDNYANLIGNGLAKVTVTTDMAQKDYGNGTGCSVSVTLTCDQSQGAMTQAAEMAQSLSKKWCEEHQQRTQAEFDARREAERLAKRR